MLNNPTALAVDSGGDVFIGDSGNHRVRMVSIYGNIQTIAGNGQVAPNPALAPVLPGEGGPAVAAPLNQIAGLAFASNGDLLISDIGNGRIFRLSSGTIHTLAGNATVPASIADQPALSATLSSPTGVAGDPYGNIYFAEQKTGIVREIDTNGNLKRIIGTGSPSDPPVASAFPLSYPLISPMSLATDDLFNLYIVEAGRISRYSPASPAGMPASIVTVAGDITQQVTNGTGDGGPPLSAGMNPKGVVLDSNGHLYIADSLLTINFHNRVRFIANNAITTFAGGNLPTGYGDQGAATLAQLYFPRALAIDSAGVVYISDTGDNRVRTVTHDGNINSFAGNGTAGIGGDGGPAIQASLNPPQGLATDTNGNLYVADGTRIRQVNPAGSINTVVGGGSSTQEGAAALAASLVQAGGLAVDGQDNIYIGQFARVSEVLASTQTISTVAGNGTVGYLGDAGPATSAQIAAAAGVAVDSIGNLYIADENNGRIRKVDATGAITTFAGGGTSAADGVAATSAALNLPAGVAVDSAGNVYIAEYGGNRVRVVSSSDGTIHTLAGNGLQGFAGDGGAATNASLNGPTDVKVDAQGNVYIADSLNSAIRKLTSAAVSPTPFISSISNAGSLTGGPVAPGERVLLTGSFLGPNSQVTFGSTAAPVLSASLSSALVVVPYEVSGQNTSQVTVTTDGISSNVFTAQIVSSSPGVFTVSGTGQGPAFAFDSTGASNAAEGALAGSTVSVVCTGEGLVTPAATTGVASTQNPPSPVLPVTATIDGISADVEDAYSIPGAIGVFVVDIIVPDNVSTNSGAALQIVVGNAATQPGVSVSVLEEPDSSSDSIVRKRSKPAFPDTKLRSGTHAPGLL